jgi:hypothetical protein
MKPQIELTIRYGVFGDQSKSVAVPVDDFVMRSLMGGQELSDDPFSLMLASPCLYGGKGNAVTMRRETLQMRREIAEDISRAMVRELVKAFGVNDELDGYRIDGMSKDEREWHQRRGRLPSDN